MPAFAGMTVRFCGCWSYFVAEKRLSNELAEMTGWAPATRPSFAGGAGATAATAAGASETDGFSTCRTVAGLVSGFAAAVVFGTDVSLRLASTTLGFARTGGGADAAASAVLPPSPTLRARLEKKLSDGAGAAARASRATRCVAAV